MLFIVILFILSSTNCLQAMYDGITVDSFPYVFECEDKSELAITKSSEPGGLAITKKYWKPGDFDRLNSFTEEKLEVQDIKRFGIWGKSTLIETDKGTIYLPGTPRSLIQNPTFNGKILKLITYTGRPTLK